MANMKFLKTNMKMYLVIGSSMLSYKLNRIRRHREEKTSYVNVLGLFNCHSYTKITCHETKTNALFS